MSNQISRKEFVLSTTDGKIIERNIQESEKEVTQAMMAAMLEGVPVHVPAVFIHPEAGPVRLAICKDVMTLTAELPKVRIKTFYATHNKALVPVFDREDEPEFDITWTPPNGMKVLFIVECAAATMKVQRGHLIAKSSSNRTYLLPMGNLYATGQICLGEKDFGDPKCAYESFERAYKQFDVARWNADLTAGKDMTKARKIFRFQPDGDGFKQLDTTGKWEDSCDVIAPPILNFIKV